MKALDVIREKRDGQAHSDEAIQFLVRGASDHTIPDYQLAAWLMAVRLRGMTEAETTALTLAMAASGSGRGRNGWPASRLQSSDWCF